MPDGQLKLSIVNVYGQPVDEPVQIILKNHSLPSPQSVIHVKPAKTIVIKDLFQGANGTYQIEIDALSYIPISQFLNIPSNKPAVLVLALPVDKNKVVSVNFPEYTALPTEAMRLLDASTIKELSGPNLYNSFDDVRKAGFLNLATKAQRTLLSNGESVLANLERVTQQQGDRLFASASPTLHDELLASVVDGGFHKVSEALHSPQDGFVLVDSYKTPDHYGNLQLTFSKHDSEWSVDMDIDDAQGFEHIFQVIHNAATSQPTHPYNIHEILVQYQELDPGYTFNLASQSTLKTAAGAA